jgi:MFS family permease
LVGIVGTFGFNFQITIALVDKVVFHRGAGAFGLLSSVLAAGSLVGALLSARREHPTTRLVIGAALAFGLLEVCVGLMPSFLLLAIALAPAGFAAITFATAANSSVQLASTPAMRGRVMGVYMLVFAGGSPFGAPLVGWLSQEFGARWGLIAGGAVSASAAAAVLALHLRRAATRRGAISAPEADGGLSPPIPVPLSDIAAAG